MQIRAHSIAMVGTSLILAGMDMAVPVSAGAAQPTAHRSATTSTSFKAAVFDAGRGVKGIDLTDKGTVLDFEKATSNSPAGYAVVKGTKRTTVQTKVTMEKGGTTYISDAEPAALSDSGRIAGAAYWTTPSGVTVDADMLDGLATWASPSSPMVQPGCGEACSIDVRAGSNNVWLNRSGNLLTQSAQLHLGTSAALIDPTGNATSLKMPDNDFMALSVSGISDGNVISASGPARKVQFDDPGPYASLYQNGVLSALPVPAGVTTSYTTAISRSGGWVTGYYWDDAKGISSIQEGKILLWNAKRQYRVISGLPQGFTVTKVNNSGWILGYGNDGPYLVRNGKASRVNELAALPKGVPAGSTLCKVVAINSSGKILADACDAQGNPLAVLTLTPKK